MLLSKSFGIPPIIFEMTVAAEKLLASKFAFSSSVEADVWHPEKPQGAYEWWYFDALADGGKEAIVINFLDNYVFSPRYNTVKNGSEGGERFPAVSFVYYEDGKDPFTFNAWSGRVRMGLQALLDLQQQLKKQSIRKALLRAELYLPEMKDGKRSGISDVIRASFSGGEVLKKYWSNHATSSSTLRIWCVSLRGPCGSPGKTTNFTGTFP